MPRDLGDLLQGMRLEGQDVRTIGETGARRAVSQHPRLLPLVHWAPRDDLSMLTVGGRALSERRHGIESDLVGQVEGEQMSQVAACGRNRVGGGVVIADAIAGNRGRASQATLDGQVVRLLECPFDGPGFLGSPLAPVVEQSLRRPSARAAAHHEDLDRWIFLYTV